MSVRPHPSHLFFWRRPLAGPVYVREKLGRDRPWGRRRVWGIGQRVGRREDKKGARQGRYCARPRWPATEELPSHGPLAARPLLLPPRGGSGSSRSGEECAPLDGKFWCRSGVYFGVPQTLPSFSHHLPVVLCLSPASLLSLADTTLTIPPNSCPCVLLCGPPSRTVNSQPPTPPRARPPPPPLQARRPT